MVRGQLLDVAVERLLVEGERARLVAGGGGDLRQLGEHLVLDALLRLEEQLLGLVVRFISLSVEPRYSWMRVMRYWLSGETSRTVRSAPWHSASALPNSPRSRSPLHR